VYDAGESPRLPVALHVQWSQVQWLGATPITFSGFGVANKIF